MIRPRTALFAEVADAGAAPPAQANQFAGMSPSQAAREAGFEVPDSVPKPAAKQPEPAKTEAEPAKPDATKEEKPVESKKLDTKGKSPWDALPEIEDKKPEAKKVAPVEDEDLTPPKGLDEKGGARWKELKTIEKQFKSLNEEHATLKKQIEAAESGKSEATLKELEQLRAEKAEIEQLVAEKKMERSDEFRKSVIAPIEESNSKIAKFIELSGADKMAMQKAVGIADEMERLDAVGKILDSIENPLKPMQETALYKAIEQLHEAWGNEDRLRAQAREIEVAADAKSESSRLEASRIREQEWNQHTEAMFDTLSKKLPILKDPDIANQVKAASVMSDDVQDQVYRAQAGALFPHIVQERNTLAAKVAELQGVISDMNGSRPNTDAKQEAPKGGNDEFRGLSPSQAAQKAGYA